LRCRDFAHGKVHIRTSKSGRPRDIVLTEEGHAFFSALTAGRDPNAPLFPRADGEAWRDAMQARPMLEACLHAQINPPVGFHQLRHTWASLAVMNGVPLMIVAANLGHASTMMVEKHYGHLSPSFVEEHIKKGAPRFGVEKATNVTRLHI
jgi:integrase